MAKFLICTVLMFLVTNIVFSQNEQLDVIQKTQRHYCHFCEKGYSQITLQVNTNSARLNEELSCDQINSNKYKVYKLWINRFTNLKEEDHSLSGILWERNDRCTSSFNNSTKHDVRTSPPIEEKYSFKVSIEELNQVHQEFENYCEQLVIEDIKRKEKLNEQEIKEREKLIQLETLKQKQKMELEKIHANWIDLEYDAKKAFNDKNYTESYTKIKNLIDEIKAFRYLNTTLFELDETINPLGVSCKAIVGYHGMSANDIKPNSSVPNKFYFKLKVSNGGTIEYIILHDRVLLELLKTSLLSGNTNQIMSNSGPRLKSFITLNIRDINPINLTQRYYDPGSKEVELYDIQVFDLSVYNYLIYSSSSDYTREIDLILGFVYASQCNIERANYYWDSAFGKDDPKSLLSFQYFYSIHFSEAFQNNKCALKICKKYWKTKSSLSL